MNPWGELRIVRFAENFQGVESGGGFRSRDFGFLNGRWSKDWHARVNSRLAEVLEGEFHAACGVALPAGRNLVEFGYKPVLFWRLLILQRVTFSASVAICCPQINRSLWLLSSLSGQRPASGLSRAALCVELARNSQHCNLFRYPPRP